MKITKVKGEKKRRTFQTEGTRWVQILIEDLIGELKVVWHDWGLRGRKGRQEERVGNQITSS